jgi:DNA-nicking Smr family endonuclease
MKKPGPPSNPPAKSGTSKGKNRHLSDTESALWRHTASTAQPLKGAKSRVHAALEGLAAAPVHHGPSPNLKRSAAAARAVPSAPARPAAPAPEAPRKPPSLSEFDAKRARKLRTGQVEVDARIDLHGMRQAEAHTALRGFLHASHRKGHRVVLVITGKGAAGGASRDENWTDTMGRSERGILRRNVPQWLSEPDVRAIVVSFTTAAIRHGGDGALYVHLRRLR